MYKNIQNMYNTKKKKNMKYLRNKVNFYLNYICLVISLYCL